MAFASVVAAGGMSSVWLNATETEVYAASLLLGVLMIWAGERAGRAEEERGARQGRTWSCLTAYLIALAVPLHLTALVAAPAAIALASYTPSGIHWRRASVLTGVFVFAVGVGRMSPWMVAAGVAGILLSAVDLKRDVAFVTATVAVAVLACSALAFLYFRAQFDPAINQGDPHTLTGVADLVARRQYNELSMWPRRAPPWVQIGNLGQWTDWQVALSFGPTVYPSVARSFFTVLFLVLGYHGAVAHSRADRRTWVGLAVLLLFAALGVLVYLNLPAGPSIGYGILPENVVREARERDYFFLFAFVVWGIWAGVGAVSVATRLQRPAWTGALVACLPIVLNWRAVTRRVEPEQSLPRALAEAILESTPRNGVLLAMGDNDSYPLWYAQEVHRVRPDVAVVTVPLLPTEWYRRQVSKRLNLPDTTATQRFEGTIEAATRVAIGARARRRPLAATMSMTPAERARVGRSWTASGLVFVEGTAPIDTATMQLMAAWVNRRLGTRTPRDAIDPVNRYYRRMLDCPRVLLEFARDADSTRLDSACNYR